MKIKDLTLRHCYITSHNTVIQITQIRGNRVYAMWPSEREYEVSNPEENIIESFNVDIGDEVSFTQHGNFFKVTGVTRFSVRVEVNGDGFLEKPKKTIYKIKKMKIAYKEVESKVIRRDLCSRGKWAKAVEQLQRGDIIHCSGNEVYEYIFDGWSVSNQAAYKISKCRKKYSKGEWENYPTVRDNVTAEITAIYKMDSKEETKTQEIQMEKDWKEFDKDNLKAGMEDAKAEIAARQRATAKAKYTEIFNKLERTNDEIERLIKIKTGLEEELTLFV